VVASTRECRRLYHARSVTTWFRLSTSVDCRSRTSAPKAAYQRWASFRSLGSSGKSEDVLVLSWCISTSGRTGANAHWQVSRRQHRGLHPANHEFEMSTSRRTRTSEKAIARCRPYKQFGRIDRRKLCCAETREVL
jgi:hypothetical protein